VTIDLVPGVECHLELTSTTPGTTQRLATIDRHPFERDGDMLRIGPRSDGPVGVGDRVSTSAEGVSIDGALVGELPPRPTLFGEAEE